MALLPLVLRSRIPQFMEMVHKHSTGILLGLVKTSNIGAASASSHGISTLSKLIVCPNASTESETLCAMLAAVLIDRPDDWDMYLDQILQAYRFSVHHTTGTITYGWEMRLQVELINGLPGEVR
ncbi:hypothetical protein T11_15400 [Trichinella zimbabwensis]|uniref:Uncharacterized protein n=1 Tax=Trichinella zimbabwensis TaxID=268475 RepID=A0A0V1HH64_9BILA|nr:hypothetical protein T11_15400 [Trichinella zimbabwensis]